MLDSVLSATPDIRILQSRIARLLFRVGVSANLATILARVKNLKDVEYVKGEIIKTIDSLKLKDDDRRKVYFGNAIRMLKLELPEAPKSEAKPKSRPSRKRTKKKAK